MHGITYYKMYFKKYININQAYDTPKFSFLQEELINVKIVEIG